MEHEFGMTPEKEEILSRNPLLKAFMDKSAFTDANMYLQMMGAQLEPVLREMQGKYEAKTLFKLGYYPLVNMGGINHSFSDRLQFESKVSIVALVTAIGYQMGNLIESSKFIDDVLVRLVTAGTFGRPENDEKMNTMHDYVWIMLSTGAYWAEPNEIEKPQAPEDPDLPDVYNDFFKGKLDDL